jgi:hypothetical protein
VRRFGPLLASLVLSACETLGLSTATTSDVLPPPDLPMSDATGSSPTGTTLMTNEFEPQVVHNYTGSLPDGTGFTASLVGGEEEHVTGIMGVFVLVLGDRAFPVGEVSYRVGAGLGSAYSDGTYRSSSEGWTIEIQFNEETLESLGEGAPDIVMGSISTGSSLGMPVLLLDDPFRWDPEQFPVEVTYETFAIRRACGDQALVCSGNEVVQLIPARALYEGHRAFSATTVSIASPGGRNPSVTLGQSSAPR